MYYMSAKGLVVFVLDMKPDAMYYCVSYDVLIVIIIGIIITIIIIIVIVIIVIIINNTIITANQKLWLYHETETSDINYRVILNRNVLGFREGIKGVPLD